MIEITSLLRIPKRRLTLPSAQMFPAGCCMPQVASLNAHRVLEADIHGDTLVVTPAGDAVGFGLNVVNGEVAKVLEVAKSDRVKHLIIDLSQSNYFGSVMIGEFMRLGLAVRDRGGRIALSGASVDMQDVLRIMKLDVMWEIFPNRTEALSSIARVPFFEHVWRKRRWFAAAAAICLAIVIYIVIPRPQYERIYFPEVKKVWEDILELRHRQASDSEWEILAARADTKLKPIVAHLERYANADRPAARELLWLARDSIPQALHERNRPWRGPDAMMGNMFLEQIEALLAGKPLPEGGAPEEAGAHKPQVPTPGSTPLPGAAHAPPAAHAAPSTPVTPAPAAPVPETPASPVTPPQ